MITTMIVLWVLYFVSLCLCYRSIKRRYLLLTRLELQPPRQITQRSFIEAKYRVIDERMNAG